LFSYLDTQLTRLGSPNFHQIPINAPKCPFANNQRDGKMQMQVPQGRVAYEPSSLEPSRREDMETGFTSFDANESGQRGRVRPETFADHYSQARLFFRSQTETEQGHMVEALVFELSKVDTPHVRERIVSHLLHIDDELAQRVSAGLGMKALPAPAEATVPAQEMRPSPALQIIGKMKPTLAGRAVGLLIGNGADGARVAALKKAVEEAGATTKVVAQKIGGVALKNGKVMAADAQLAGSPSVIFDAVAIFAGDDDELIADSNTVDFIRDAFAHLKAIALDERAKELLDAGNLVADEGITSTDKPNFAKLAQKRFWKRENGQPKP
jgi:catalase